MTDKMKSSIIQFHAAPDELAKFVSEVADEFALNLVLMRFLPVFSCTSLTSPKELENIPSIKDGIEVNLTLATPKLDVKNQIEFYEKNPGCLIFRFGRWLPQGLRQSSVSYRTDDKAVIEMAKNVLVRLKKVTEAGVRVINPRSGEIAFEKSFRYTKGAMALERAGVQMLPSGGNLIALGLEA